ncbi:rod shape-determining protein RodA [Parvularcula dongshanensis]|uniref:Peptidoglycan glycosyltransferase MrdB n=1 Tax=Parvularcula dongshanensis TaxID=1173995 RepID=A0A840I3F8_9PROT|nr:rod shape-determining protein RodA [Parvularcula dongshanensis]MBB4659536.1 rod shape determining protein RodA [Parvularcula dongshanensis]
MALALPDRRLGIRGRLMRLNWLLIALLTVIASIGVVTLYSVADGSWSPYASRHVIRFCAALVLLVGVGITPLRFWLWIAYPAYFGALALLLLVPLIGETNMGAERWIAVGSFQLQPSELMKVALVLALARYYHGLEFKRVSHPFGLIPPLLMIGAPTGLVFLQPDLGTAILVALSGFSVMLLAGLSWRWVVVGAIAGFAAVVTAIQTGLIQAYQWGRITAFLDPTVDPLGANYHANQSKIAIGSGGIDGKGFMEGTQSQLGFLPEMHTDFIFTIYGEEFGLIGALGLLGLYFGTFLVAMNIAMRAKSHFGRLLTMGIALTFVMYVLINTGMVMGLAPVVGVPLPLVSYGGTVMIAMMGGFGLVMSTWIYRNQDTLRTQGAF